MKEKARLSYIKQLEKENLDINISCLSDLELRQLYLKLQYSKSYVFPYFVNKDLDGCMSFEDMVLNKKIVFVSFRNTPGVRRMNFKEFLFFDNFCLNNPGLYLYHPGNYKV